MKRLLATVRRFWKGIAAALGVFVLLTTAFLNLEQITSWITSDAGEMGSVNMRTERAETSPTERAETSVLFEQTRKQMRDRNRVREMWELEDQQESSLRLAQVYGFAGYADVKRVLDRWRSGRAASDAFSVRLSRKQSIFNGVELHVLEDGRVIVLLCVSDGDAARLSDPAEGSRRIFGFYLDCSETRPVLAGIPVSRVRDWEVRTVHFGLINVD